MTPALYQIITCLYLLISQQCSADNDTYLDILEKQSGEVKTSSYMENHDLINMKIFKIDSTSIKIQIYLSDKQPPSYRSQGLLHLKEIHVNMSAQLLYGELTRYHSTLLCQLKERVSLNQDSNISREKCRKELFSFRAFNLKSKKFDLEMSYFCKSREEIHVLDLDGGYFIVDGLLPSQTYKFNITFSSITGKVSTPLETKVEYVCMPKGPPQSAPQTDLASYSVGPTGNRSDNLELISLLWRPLPTILVGGPDSRYEIYCEDDYHKNTHNITIKHLQEGSISFYKPKDKSIICRVQSSSPTENGIIYSPIIVPDGNNRIFLSDKFRFYAYAVSNEEYLFDWTPITINSTTKEVTIHNTKANKKNFQIDDGHFTVYWCIPGRAAGCSSLEGLWQFNTTPSYFVFPSRTDLTPRRFGISYTHYSPAMSTGIIWSECDSSFGHQFIHEQLRISKAAPYERNHTSLFISWAFPGCNSQAATIDFYQINYCKVSQLTGCSAIWSEHPVIDLSDFRFDTSNDRQCVTRLTPREFQESAIIHNLSPASNYVIRIRYVLGNGTTNAWSEPKSAATLPDPESTDHCWRTYIWKMGIAGIGVIVVLSFLAVRTPGWLKHFHIMQSKFKETTGGICSFVTNMNAERDSNDVIFQYCANTGKDELMRSKSDLSLSFLHQDESLKLSSLDNRKIYDEHNSQSDYNHMNQIFDYIPKNLLEGCTQDAAPETSSEKTGDIIRFEHSSEQDEISFNSQQFIWEANSNCGLDSNNNQTDTTSSIHP